MIYWVEWYFFIKIWAAIIFVGIPLVLCLVLFTINEVYKCAKRRKR